MGFAFECLFPPIFRFPIRQISNLTYALFKNVGCCETQTKANKQSKTQNLINNNDNFGDLVLNLRNANANQDSDSDTDTFTKSILKHKDDDSEAKKRQEAKLLIERRLQQIQKQYNQRIIDSAKQPTSTAAAAGAIATN